MTGAPILIAAAVPTELLVAAFLLLVIAFVAVVVAVWLIAADRGWLDPLEGYDSEEPTTSPEPLGGPPPSAPPAHAPIPAPIEAVPQAPESPLCREEEVDRATPIVVDPETEDTVPAEGRPRFGLVAAGLTDRGRKRPRNEDHLALASEAGLFVVADGMGGYAGGLLAARLCCEVIVQSLTRGTLPRSSHEELPGPAVELVAAIQAANRVVHQRSLEDPALEGMGTTVVCARFHPEEGRLYVGHVGDSRVYRLRDGRIQQLTIDHTMARFGVRGKAASALSRAIGVGPGVHVDLIMAEPRCNDVYLLCTDGLTKMVRNPELLRRALAEASDPEEAVAELVRMANDAGGKDNVTAVVIGVGEVEARSDWGEGARRGA